MCPVTIVPTEVKCPISYFYFDESCIFSTDFYAPQYQNGYPSMGGGGPAVIQADKWTNIQTHRETDIMKLIGAFCSYSNALKNWERWFESHSKNPTTRLCIILTGLVVKKLGTRIGMAAGKPNAVITYHFNSSGCHSYLQEKEEYCCLLSFRRAVREVKRKKIRRF